MKIRTTKTGSGSTAVQVVRYERRKKVIEKHIGSGCCEEEVILLKEEAYNWITKKLGQGSLFSNSSIRSKCNSEKVRDSYNEPILRNVYKSSGYRYQVLYKVLQSVAQKFRFDLIAVNQIKLLNDLVISRIVFPGSKVESIRMIERDFGIKHQYRTLSRNIKSFLKLKEIVEENIVRVAKAEFNFDFAIVYYDLTTLYFESFETDNLRRIGFSKDNKGSNPQIMIGLLVNAQGFPISYQIFPGNKFEGHTLAPSILSIKNKYKINRLTVVADAAMVSEQNIKLLTDNNLNYIVGARMANLSITTIQEISEKLQRQHDQTIRIQIDGKDDLICHFSTERYRKEKRELKKQLDKAEEIIKTPSKAEIIKRAKFLTNNKKDRKFELNEKLVMKARLLLGIRGYYSNHRTDNNLEIVDKYRQLWNVERSFKISKSDLKARPIFHSKDQSIRVHILICFMALAISKYIEIKTQKSIKSAINTLKDAVSVIIVNKNNNNKIILDPQIDNQGNRTKLCLQNRI